MEGKPFVLITGASSGIGRELARGLAKKGYNVILVARRAERLEELKIELTSNYRTDVVIKAMDISLPENTQKLYDETITYKPLIVINNAGFGQYGSFEEIPPEKESEMIRLNIDSLSRLTKLFASGMERGLILNVASMAAFLPTPLMAAYAASKAFVLNYSLAANSELVQQKKPVRIKILCPGPVETEFADVARVKTAFKGITPKKCAEIAIRNLDNKKTIIIPGMLMKIARVALRIFTKKTVMAISYRYQKKKR